MKETLQFKRICLFAMLMMFAILNLKANPPQSTITFNSAGGTAIAPITQGEGTAVTDPADPTKAGYTFQGWSPAVPATMPVDDMTCIAQWQSASISADLNLEVGWYNSTTKVFTPLTPGETISMNDIIAVRIIPTTDYLAGASSFVIMFDKTLFTVQGSNTAAFIANTDVNHIDLNVPTSLPGYSGNHYYDFACTGFSGSTNIPDGSWPASFAAGEKFDVYKAIKVGTQVDGNNLLGGYTEVIPGNWLFQFRLKANANIIVGTDARIWMDARWFRSSTNTTADGRIPKCLPGNLGSSASTIYPFNFDFSGADIKLSLPGAPTTTITFNVDGGSPIAPITGDEGSAVFAPANPTKAGYTFSGWLPAIPATFPVDDLTCVAQWNPATDVIYTINIFHEKASLPGTYELFFMMQQTGTTGTLGSVTPANYDGFIYNAGASNASGIIAPDGSLVLNLYYDLDAAPTSTISFDVAGGTPAIAPITQDEGTAVTAPADPTKAGFTFLGWVPAVPATMPVDDLTCIAQWEATTPCNAGEIWTSRTSIAGTEFDWFSITYGNGLFVAISSIFPSNYQVMTSPDGITWTGRTAAQANSWSSVTYGNGLFVAVAVNGTNRVMTSPNGITWTARTAASAFNWISVTYGAGLFVAVANSGDINRVMTSPDGITWTARTATEAANWKSVTYGSGVYVAVSQNGAIMTSTDGFTWTAQAAAAANSWRSVTYGNGLFVALGELGAIMTSPNGITWTTQIDYKPNTWQSVTYGNGIYVAVAGSEEAGNTNCVMTSPNGITWTTHTAAESANWGAVTYGNGRFVAVTSMENKIMTSDCISSNPTSTITFDVAGGSAIAPITQDEGTAVTAPADPTKAGYTFNGWLPALPATMPADDMTCVAQWTPVIALPQYYNYNTNGTNNSFPFGNASGKKVQLLYLPGDFTQPSAAPAGNISVLYFRIADSYPINSWTYTDLTIKMGQSTITSFDAGTFYTGTLTTVYYKASVTLSATGGSWLSITLDNSFTYDPAKSLIVDIGHCAAPGAIGYPLCFTNLTNNRRNSSSGGCVYSYYSQGNHVYHIGFDIGGTTTPQSTITFDVAGGTPAISPITQDEGTAITAPADPTKAGFTFSGWNPAIPATMPVDDMTCVAQWTENVSVGGTLSGTTFVCYGTNSTTLTLSGHTGSIVKWVSSTDNWVTTVDIANTATTYTATNLTTTTKYRVEVTNGGSSSSYSSVATVNVYDEFKVGSISADQTICANTVPAALTGVAPTGGATPYSYQWQKSTDNINFADINLNGTSLNYTSPALTQTTYFRLKQTSGGTPPSSPNGPQNTASIGCGTLITDTVTITVEPVSAGGTLGGTTFVCYGTNSTLLTLSGHTGDVVKWSYSTDNWVTSTDITNVTTTYTATNLTTTTKYRVEVKSGVCTSTYSSVATVNVYDEFKVGSISADQTICSNTAPATLVGVAPTGGATPYSYQWQSSSNNSTFSDINVNGTSLNYSPPALSQTTYYRLKQTSGGNPPNVPNGPQNTASIGCGTKITDTITITVDPVSVGGSLAGSTTVCSGNNNTTLTLSGHVGTIIKWQSTTTNWLSPTDIANTSTTYEASNLTTTTKYRVVVKSGVCSVANSSVATITVDPVTVGGSVGVDADVCINANNKVLNLTGRTGSILRWESSTDNFVTTSNIANLTTSYTVLNITQTTKYRAVVQSGVCSIAYSSPATITVHPLPEVTFEGTFEEQHLCGDPITLTGGLPLGGTYSGTGVSSGMFDPSVAGPGTWTITYTYKDIWGCTSSETNSITVMEPETFTYFVGVGGDFENLTGENGLFDFLNSNRRCGDVYAMVLNDLSEDGTHGLNQSIEVIPGGYNLTIWPVDETQKLISGNVAQAMIRLNGIDRMTFDGGIFWPYRAFKIRNNNAGFPTLLVNNGINNLNISGCEIEGNNTNPNTGVVVLESVGGSNNNILFYRNIIGNIHQSPNAPTNLFYASGSGSNSNIGLNTNEFRNYSTNGVFVTSSGNGSNWNIFNNSFYATMVFSGNQTGINFIPGSSSSNNIISTNYIGGSNYQIYGDNFVNSGNGFFKAISVNTGGVTISKNSVGNIKLSNTGTPVFTGIEVLSGAATVDQSNIIGSLNVLYSITMAGTGNFYGIRSLSTSAVIMRKNIVSNINYSSNLGAPKAYCFWLKRGTADQNRVYNIGSQYTTMMPWFYGIYTESSGTTNTITNNMIALKGGNSSNPKLFGIYDKSASTTNTYYHNTVNIQGSVSPTATNLTAALYREGTATFNLYNNILHNAKASTPAAKHWGFYSTSTATLNSNYNDLVTASPNLVYWGGITYNNLSVWKTATRDYNSINVVPVYTSTIDLHLTTANSGINNKGTGAYSLATDFDGAPRSVTNPDIGCDEFVGAPAFFEPEVTEDLAIAPSLSIYPNPIQATSIISVVLESDSKVNIQVFNAMGALVVDFGSRELLSGTSKIEFNSGNLPAGIYICRMVVNNEKLLVQRIEIIR
jgi:hypothetical protein